MNLTLTGFRTDPDSKNPYAFEGTTESDERFSWSGVFSLDPLRSQGEISFQNVALTRFSALYEDVVRFQLKDGVMEGRSAYRFEFSETNLVIAATNGSFRLQSLKVGEEAKGANVVELQDFSVTDASMDVPSRQAEVGHVAVSGCTLFLKRDAAQKINLVELSKPPEGITNLPGGILLIMRAATNLVAMLASTTNQWAGTVHEVKVENSALLLEDLANSRPVRLQLDQISLVARQLSNRAGTNLTANLSVRWNTNGWIKTEAQGSFSPTVARAHIGFENVELRGLDPYLESRVNAFVLGSKLSLDANVQMHMASNAELPQVTLKGDAQLDDFATVDGMFGEDLLKWGSVRVSGIDATLSPPVIGIREIAVDDVYARIVIQTNGGINLLSALRISQTNSLVVPAASGKGTGLKGPAKLTAIDTGSLPKIAVEGITISNSALHFTDRSISPNVNLALEKIAGKIGRISTESRDSAESNLHASVDNVGPVEVKGRIDPFNRSGTNDLTIVAKNVDLTPTSPYVGKFAGYRLARGKLEMNLTYHLYGDKMKGENQIVLDRFTFGEKVDSPDATKLPVRLAVAILKDREGKIQLDVPVDGSLQDPEFRVRKVVIHAIGNLLSKIATSPFSVLGAVFGGKGEEISYQDFPSGSAELQAESREKLDALIKGLYERPGLELEIEGSVDPDKDLVGIRKNQLQRRLQMEKWKSLRKSERAAITSEQVTLLPDERPRWVKEVYTEALAKGELKFGDSLTNAVGATNLSAQVSIAHGGGSQKGVSRLMEMAVGTDAKGLASGPRGPDSDDPMEQALLDSIQISPSDLQELAAARAKAVRTYILASERVEPERLFLVESPSAKAKGSKVYLQFR